MRRWGPGHGDDRRASVLSVTDDDTVLEGGDEPVVRLVAWDGDWPDDDPDANLKADVAVYSKPDPLVTMSVLGGGTGIPIGALVRYVCAKWASGGSEGLLELGPSTVRRMHALVEEAEQADTDEARLDAYDQLRQMIGWLHVPIEDG